MQFDKFFPANLLKFNAYVKVVKTLDDAIKIIKEKRLAWGEPCVVSYNTNTPTGIRRKVLFGIGSMDPNDPYFFNIEYDAEGNPHEQTELLERVQKIIDEWEEHGGFVVTSVKYSKTEAPNITDSEFTCGDLILGEAAIKKVTDSVSESSPELVTSGGVFKFIGNIVKALEDTINDISNEVDNVKTDVSILKRDVSVLKTHDASAFNSVVSDASLITVNAENKTIRIGLDVSAGFSEGFSTDKDNRICLMWHNF